MTRRVMAGAICWVLDVEYYVAEWIARAGWPGYRASQYDISALGVTSCGQVTDPVSNVATLVCSPRHAIMNAGFIVGGLLTVAGALLTRRAWAKRSSATAGMMLVAVAGAGEIMVGLFPSNEHIGLHITGALLHWICAGVGFLTLGTTLWNKRRLFAGFSFLCGSVMLAALSLYATNNFWFLGRGGMERVVSHPSSIWLMVTGVALLAAGGKRFGADVAP